MRRNEKASVAAGTLQTNTQNKSNTPRRLVKFVMSLSVIQAGHCLFLIRPATALPKSRRLVRWLTNNSSNNRPSTSTFRPLIADNDERKIRNVHRITREEKDDFLADFDDEDWGQTATTLSEEEGDVRPTQGSPQGKTQWTRYVRKTTGDVLTAVGFVTSSTMALLFDRQQFKRLKPTVVAFGRFLKTSGIDLELSPTLNLRLLDNLVILSRVQRHVLLWEDEETDRRDLAAFPPGMAPSSTPTKEEAIRYMKYATAAYGKSMIRAVEMGVDGIFDTNINRLMTRASIGKHVGIPEEDIIQMDVAHEGNSKYLRHFVAVDHLNKKVVLAIRGTFSLSEVIVDVAAFSSQFCGGEAHTEMAKMARRVWNAASDTVLEQLDKNEGYEFILTGHSLGAGTACLLNILCHRNRRELVRGRKVRCFAYAAPPVFTPLDFVPDAVKATTNFIHSCDVVPFLSVDSVRRLFASIRAIESTKLSWRERVRLMSGREQPDPQFCKDVLEPYQKGISPKSRAPRLEIPAATNFWLHSKDARLSQYDAKICSSRRLSALGIFVDANMFQDHFPTRYEESLLHLTEDSPSN